MDRIEQGETYTFATDLTGDDADGFTVTMRLLQYPGDTPTITRSLALEDGEYTGALTSAETISLDIGQWFIHISSDDPDEDVREPLKLYVSKGWHTTAS